jgi:hypothetical protein
VQPGERAVFAQGDDFCGGAFEGRDHARGQVGRAGPEDHPEELRQNLGQSVLVACEGRGDVQAPLRVGQVVLHPRVVDFVLVVLLLKRGFLFTTFAPDAGAALARAHLAGRRGERLVDRDAEVRLTYRDLFDLERRARDDVLPARFDALDLVDVAPDRQDLRFELVHPLLLLCAFPLRVGGICRLGLPGGVDIGEVEVEVHDDPHGAGFRFVLHVEIAQSR